MIKEIKIENFKSIESLNLELGRLNVFIGANGSGKSNILEGIAMGAAAVEDKLDDQYLKSKGIKICSPESMRSGFQHKNKLAPIVIQFDHNLMRALQFTLEHDNEPYSQWWNSGKDTNEQFGEVLAKYGAYKDEEGNLTKISDSEIVTFKKSYKDFVKSKGVRALGIVGISDFMIYSPEYSKLQDFEDSENGKPLSKNGEGLFKLVVSIAKKKPEQFEKINQNLHLLEWFDGLEIPDNLMFTERRAKIGDSFLKEGLKHFDQRSANEGFLFLLFYMTLFISDYTPKFFAIENIDTAMNPKLSKKLIKILGKLAKDNNKQVILTTHNPAILDGLNLTNSDSDQRLFVVYRDMEGATSVRRVLPKKIENGATIVPLSEQFLRGYLGGLPDNF
jgi:predicted ATPase